MRSALEAYRRDRPTVRAIFMGTRRTDPHCEFLTHFSPTDKDWPQFMRVNPVIDWHYVEIWAVSCPNSPSLIAPRGFGAQLHRRERHDFADRSYSLSATSKSPFAACTSKASHRWAA